MSIFWGLINAGLSGSILFYYIPRIRKLISEINILRLSLEESQGIGDMYHRQYIDQQESANIGLSLLSEASVEIRNITNTRDRLAIEIQEIRDRQASIVSERSHLTTEIQRINEHVRAYQNQLRTQNIPEPSPQEITDLVNAERMIDQNTPSSLLEAILSSGDMQESLRRVITTDFIAPPLSDYPPTTEDDSRITESDEQRGLGLMNQYAAVRGVISEDQQRRAIQSFFNTVQEQTFQSTVLFGTQLTPKEQELSDKIEELSEMVIEKDQLITLLKNLIREFHSNSVYKESDGDKRRYRLPISIAITVEELLNK